MGYRACFDIGGTFIKFAVVSEAGELFLQGKTETPTKDVTMYIPQILSEKVAYFREYYPIENIGISSCGIVDHNKGVILFSANIEGYSGFPLAHKISEFTGLSVSVENDVRSACLGEMWLGAAQGKENVVLLTLGTGVGGAIIQNGRLVSGAGNLAGELGHMSIIHNGENCPCGGKGCFERYASTSSLIRYYQTIVGKEESIDGKEIMSKIKQGEKAAIKAYQEFIDYLSTGLVNIAHLFNPECIIIGGGITEQGESFINEVNSKYKEKVMPLYRESTKIVLAELHNDAALYGAFVHAGNFVKK